MARIIIFIFTASLAPLLPGGPARAQEPAPALQWFKGNTHTHTLESDGDSTPDDVTKWYRDHGYHFLVITDHNVLTQVDALNAKYAAPDRFLVIKGEEVSNRLGEKALHVNGLNVTSRVPAEGGASVVDVLQRAVDGIRKAGGVPHINHPNFTWAVTPDEIRQVRDNRLFEIFNGHPQVNNIGGGGVPGLEAAWDSILTNGILLYGIAVDDAHNFKDPGNPNVAGPGRGWVTVRAARLDAPSIMEALERGDFYASTGVELTDYSVSASSMTVTVKKVPWAKYRIEFIGLGGRVLHEALDSPARYEFRGDEGYVRAKVIDSNGRVAWCQPVLARPQRR